MKLVELGVGRGKESVTDPSTAKFVQISVQAGVERGMIIRLRTNDKAGPGPGQPITGQHPEPVMCGRVKVGARSWERKSGNCAELSQALASQRCLLQSRLALVTRTTSTSQVGRERGVPLTFNQNTLNEENTSLILELSL